MKWIIRILATLVGLIVAAVVVLAVMKPSPWYGTL